MGDPVEPCPACGASIIWGLDGNAKRVPVDALAHPDGTYTLLPGWDGRPRVSKLPPKLAFGRRNLHQPHTSTCRRPSVLKEHSR